jgi:hypothetical protein
MVSDPQPRTGQVPQGSRAQAAGTAPDRLGLIVKVENRSRKAGLQTCQMPDLGLSVCFYTNGLPW